MTVHPRGFSREDAAAYAGISVYRIRAAIRDNRLPAKKHGKDILVLREDLDAYIDAMEPA